MTTHRQLETIASISAIIKTTYLNGKDELALAAMNIRIQNSKCLALTHTKLFTQHQRETRKIKRSSKITEYDFLDAI